MPFEINDEALTALNSASDDERRGFVDSLTDDQAGQVADALNNWRTRTSTKGVGVMGEVSKDLPRKPLQLSIGEPTVLQGEPKLGLEIGEPEDVPQPPVQRPLSAQALRASTSVPQAVTKTAQGQVANAEPFLDKANQFKDTYIAKPLQGAADAGLGLLRKADSALGLPVESDQLVARRALQPVLGEEWANKMSDEDAYKADQQLGAFSVPMQTAAHMATVIPGVVFNPLGILGIGEHAAAAVPEALPPTLHAIARVSAKLLAGGVEGGLFGAGSALPKEGEKIEDSTAQGAIAGTALSALGTAAGAAGKYVAGKLGDAVAKVAHLSPEASMNLAREIGALSRADAITDVLPGMEETQVGTGVTKVKPAEPPRQVTAVTKIIPGARGKPAGTVTEVRQQAKANLSSADFKPGLVGLNVNEDGKVVATFAELNADGSRRAADLVINDRDDARKFANLVHKHDLDVTYTPEAALAAAGKTGVFETMLQNPAQHGTPPSLDAPPPGFKPPPQAVVVDEAGNVRLRRDPTGNMRGPSYMDTAVVEPTNVTPKTDTLLMPEDVKKMMGIVVPEGAAGKPYKPTRNPELLPEKPPPPQEVPPAGPVDDENSKLFNGAAEMARQLAIKRGEKNPADPNLWQKVLPLHLRYGQDLGNRIMELQAARTLAATGEDEAARIVGLLPKGHGIQSAFDHDVQRYTRGLLSHGEMERRYPAVWKDFESRVNKQIEELQANSKSIADLGGIPEQLERLRDQGQKEKYVARMYKAYLYGDAWLKHGPSNVWQDAVDAIRAKSPTWSPEQVATELANIVRAPNVRQAMLQSPLGAPWKNLMKRVDDSQLPSWLRNLLGEEESGAISIGLSLGKQRAILAQLRAWADIMQNPAWFSPHQTPQHSVPVPGNSYLFGRAAGGWVAPQLEEVVQAGKVVENPWPLWQSIGGYIKGNQVVMGGARQWFNAIIGNTLYSTLVPDGIPVWRPEKAAKYLYLGAQAMHDNHVNGGRLGGLLLEMKEFGVDIKGHVGNEVSGEKGVAARELMKLAEANKDSNMHAMLGKMGDVVHKWFVRNPKRALEAYDWIDRVWKAANYIHIKERALAKGATEQEAARTAAWQINRAFPNPQFPNMVAQAVRKSPYGMGAPYGTYSTEDVRIMGHVLEDIKNGDVTGMPARLAGFAAAMGGLYGVAKFLRRANGITDEQVDAIHAQRKQNGQAWRPLMMVMPWRETTYDAKGGKVEAPAVWDLTPLLGPTRFLAGHPDNGIAKNVFVNLLKSPIEGGLVGQMVDKVATGAGLYKVPDRMTPQPAPTAGLVERGVNTAQDVGLLPGVFREGREMLRKMDSSAPTWLKGGVRGKYEEQMPVASAALRMFPGIPTQGTVSIPGVTPGPQPSVLGKLSELQRQLGDMDKQIRSVGSSRLPPEEKTAQIRAIIQQRIQVIDQYRQLGEALKRAQPEKAK